MPRPTQRTWGMGITSMQVPTTQASETTLSSHVPEGLKLTVWLFPNLHTYLLSRSLYDLRHCSLQKPSKAHSYSSPLWKERHCSYCFKIAWSWWPGHSPAKEISFYVYFKNLAHSLSTNKICHPKYTQTCMAMYDGIVYTDPQSRFTIHRQLNIFSLLKWVNEYIQLPSWSELLVTLR